MKFNVNKCKVLHIGNNNQYTKYTMNACELPKVNHEILRVTISNDLKPSKYFSGTLLRKLTNWSASSDEFLNINL